MPLYNVEPKLLLAQNVHATHYRYYIRGALYILYNIHLNTIFYRMFNIYRAGVFSIRYQNQPYIY